MAFKLSMLNPRNETERLWLTSTQIHPEVDQPDGTTRLVWGLRMSISADDGALWDEYGSYDRLRLGVMDPNDTNNGRVMNIGSWYRTTLVTDQDTYFALVSIIHIGNAEHIIYSPNWRVPRTQTFYSLRVGSSPTDWCAFFALPQHPISPELQAAQRWFIEPDTHGPIPAPNLARSTQHDQSKGRRGRAKPRRANR